MRRLAFALPLIPVLLLSCAPTTAVQVPSLEVQEIRLTDLSLPLPGRPAVAGLTVQLRVTNPNPVPLRLTEIQADLIIDGAAVGRLTLPEVSLPAQGQVDQPARASLPLTASTFGSVVKVARGQAVTYRLDGTFRANLGPLGQPTFGPLTLSQGVWQQPALISF